MAYSYEVTVASGSSDLVNVPFGYINTLHVHVSLDDVEVTQSTLVWNSASQIQLPETPSVGVEVKVYRVTPITSLSVIFQPGPFDSSKLNSALLASLYMVQEARDASDDVLSVAQAVEDTLAGIIAELNGIVADGETLAAEMTTLHDEAVTAASTATTKAGEAEASATASAGAAVAALDDRITISTDAPSGGVDGDIWFRVS